MDEYGNIKTSQFKNDSSSLTMTSVPVFPTRQLPGAFQNSPMTTPYSFNMDGMLGHAPTLYGHPPPPHHSNTTKMNSLQPEPEQRQMNLSFGKPSSMAYTSFPTVSSFNIVTTNGFYVNTAPEASKHSFEDVLNSQPNYSSDPSLVSKMHYHHQPPSSVMSDVSQYPHESMNSFIQNLNPVPNEVHIIEHKKRLKVQKGQHKPVHSHDETQVVVPLDQNQVNGCSVQNNIGVSHNDLPIDNYEISGNNNVSDKLYHSGAAYKCGFCLTRFPSNDALLGHLNTHTDFMAYCCGLCNMAFVEGKQLVEHVQQAHTLKTPYACGLCDLSFYCNDELMEHLESHNQTDQRNNIKQHKHSSVVKENRKIITKFETDMADEVTAEDDDDDDEDDNSGEHFNPRGRPANSASNTILIGKETNFSLRKGPSKIVMDDVDLSTVCTVIVEPSSAGGIRKKHLFKCNFCEKICKDKGSLVSHVRTHTKGRPYECNMCMAKFKQYAHLSDHIMTKHTKERPFVCDRCAKTFNRKSHLQDHIRLRHTEDKLYHCSECSLTFQKRTEFSEHKRTHGKTPKYMCNMCPRQFRNVTDYERHIRSHTKEKRYECEVCHLTFGLLANAKKHMVKHTEDRPYKCEVCPKAYHFEHDYKRHKSTHLKKKPFPCSDCYKSFKNDALLKRHAKETHMKSEDDPLKKPFKCETCRKRFKIQWDLDRHRKIHAKKKPFPCLFCYKTYGSEPMLAKHARVHEGQDLPLYDHSKDIIEDFELEQKDTKSGRNLNVKNESESNDQNGDMSPGENSKRGSWPKKVKDQSSPLKPSHGGKRGKPKDDSDLVGRKAPSIKITFRRRKRRSRKFQCLECNKTFVSKELLRRHSQVHMDEDTEEEEPPSLGENLANLSSCRGNINNVAASFSMLVAGRSIANKIENTTVDDETTLDQTTASEGEDRSSPSSCKPGRKIKESSQSPVHFYEVTEGKRQDVPKDQVLPLQPDDMNKKKQCSPEQTKVCNENLVNAQRSFPFNFNTEAENASHNNVI